LIATALQEFFLQKSSNTKSRYLYVFLGKITVREAPTAQRYPYVTGVG
jgi:hypothetical protein